ncbi:MAG TPA: DedA family protein [Myxococcales bacterium]|nr:DedA family protein [Myxococcales bacterium]
MSEFLLHLLTTAHGTFAYTLVFGFLVACGLGLPLPEDVALVMGGYLSFIGAANLWLMLVFALCGILGGDLLVYAAGHRYGQELAHTRWLHRYLTDEKRKKVEGYFARYGQGLVVAARFLPGLRVVTYFSAGASEMGAGRFLLFDALAACVSAPLWVFIGRRLGRHVNRALIWVSRFHWVLMGVAAVIGLGVAIFLLRRNGGASSGKGEVAALDGPAAPRRERTGSTG